MLPKIIASLCKIDELKKLINSFILEELLVAVMSKKLNILLQFAKNAHAMLLCLVEIILPA